MWLNFKHNTIDKKKKKSTSCGEVEHKTSDSEVKKNTTKQNKPIATDESGKETHISHKLTKCKYQSMTVCCYAHTDDYNLFIYINCYNNYNTCTYKYLLLNGLRYYSILFFT